MTDPIDDENENIDEAAARKREEEGKQGKSGSAGGSGGVKIAAKDAGEEDERRKKKDDSGEGDSDSFGRGKAGAGAGGVRIPPNKLKEVMSEWRHLVEGNEVLRAVAEFFSEWPMRASANLQVSWDVTKNAKSFAIVNWVINAGKGLLRELERTRERARGAGRDSRTMQRRRPKTSPAMNASLNGPTGPTHQ